MTVRELIEALSKLDQNLPVVTNGYEGGRTYIKGPYTKKIGKVDYKRSYSGEFEDEDYFDDDTRPEGKLFHAVLISRSEEKGG